MRTQLQAITLSLFVSACGGAEGEIGIAESTLDIEAASTLAKLGRRIFFDARLSEPAGQSCASCHDPEHEYADGRAGPTSEGAVHGRFGSRNTPSIIYTSYTPELKAGGAETGYSGGLFWDGRSPDLEDQIYGPMLNPIEMNNPDTGHIIDKVKHGPYAAEFLRLFGSDAFDDPDAAFDDLTQAVAAFERKGISGRFTSKYDAYLAGQAHLDASEQRGLAIFEDPLRGNCASCQTVNSARLLCATSRVPRPMDTTDTSRTCARSFTSTTRAMSLPRSGRRLKSTST